ncbi:hypothetical protein V8F20_002477 [Naviculisporaceae sp. PSN 640]
MVGLTLLSKAVAIALMLVGTAVCQTPQPLTVEDVKAIYSDLTSQTRTINTTAKEIDPSFSFIWYGWTGGGAVKDFLDLLGPINTLLKSTTEFLDESITPPIGSSTQVGGQDPPKDIYDLHKALMKEVRYEFRTIKKQSTGISCDFLGLVHVASCEIGAREVRAALEEHKDALWDFRYAIQSYDFLYGVEIQDDWVLQTLSDITAAIKTYDQFAPEEEEE